MTGGETGLSPVPSHGGPFVYVADLSAPALDEADHHHLARVRRLRPGDPLVLGDGAGSWCPARFAGSRPEPQADPTRAPRLAPPVAVGFALVKGAKPELVVQKLAELGVDHIHPFVAGRSVVRWDAVRAGRARIRLDRVGREAAMQSRRAWPPTVEAVVPFAELASAPGASRADRGGRPPSLDRPLILTGPEGGWDDAEQAYDVPVVALGDGVLRAETAAIAAGVVLTALRSGLVSPAR